MKPILVIGNSGCENSADGQTIKVRLYLDILKRENIPYLFVNLNCFSKHPFSTLHKIKTQIKKCSRILLISAQRGTKFLIPFINRINKKHNLPFILPMVGVNILHKYIDSLNDKDHFEFMYQNNFKNIKPNKKDIKQLSKITYILPENNQVKTTIESFFGLKNVEVLDNFRVAHIVRTSKKRDHNILHLVFLSRVMRQKGIFELMDAVKRINEELCKIKLDIYGPLFLDSNESKQFYSCLNENISYLGQIKNDVTIETIANYDLFVFPTLFKSEGTPGVISESFIAGVPVLSSNFPQASSIMNNGKDSILYDSSNPKLLEQNLLMLYNNRQLLKSLSYNAKMEGEKHTYKANRHLFLKFVCGVDE